MSAADEALHEAIAARAAEISVADGHPPPGPLTHYNVVAATLEPDGEDEDMVWLMMTGGSMPNWQVLGLLEAGRNALLDD